MQEWASVGQHIFTAKVFYLHRIMMDPKKRAAQVLRNLSPQRMFEQIALSHRPLGAFEDGDFAEWKGRVWPEVAKTLGDFPERPPLNPQCMAAWEHDGLWKERWLIDVHEFLSASFIIAYPEKPAGGQKWPTIFCWHGHGYFGKEPVMGNDSSAALRAEIESSNYSYGHQMAKQGFVTYAIDWIGGGERCDSHRLHGNAKGGGRDWCNLYYLHATMLGMTNLSINLTHGVAATDFACSLPGIDSNRMGVMGLSGGGTMALWSGLWDTRFKAVEIICYSDLWALFGVRDVNYCGMQVAPGLYKWVDLPDLQGLLAPKPLLLDIGVYDSGFRVDGAMECFRGVEKIYEAAGARDKLQLDLFPGEHSWSGRLAPGFWQTFLS